MFVKGKLFFAVVLVVALAVPMVGAGSIEPVQAAQLCSLIDFSGSYADGEGGAGNGTALNSEGAGACFNAVKGDTLHIIAQHADGGRFSGGVHGPGGFAVESFTGWGGVGYSSTTIIIPETGEYCIGLGYCTEATGCFPPYDDEGIVSMNAYIGCIPQGTIGPDMIPIPPHVSQGTFVTTTNALFAPDAAAVTPHVMEAGRSVWVYGIDESGEFYYVALSGRFFWVPADTIGPNYDEVWNGRPLPTEVVG